VIWGCNRRRSGCGSSRRTSTRAGGICQQCGKARATDAHHLTYVRLGFEEDKDLRALCAACHRLAHPERRYA
jgi:hypothetical protein